MAPALVTNPHRDKRNMSDFEDQTANPGDSTAAPLSAAEAPACPSHRHESANAHGRMVMGTWPSSEDQPSNSEASAAAPCALAAEEKLNGLMKQGEAAGADAQVLETLTTRILGANCVQQAMQTVQAQHAKRARQAAKLKAQPGQASAPGEGRRQRSRKRKLEGEAAAVQVASLSATLQQPSHVTQIASSSAPQP